MVSTEISKSKKKNIAIYWLKHKNRLIGYLLIILLLSLFPSPNIYFQSVSKTSGVGLPVNLELPESPPYPVNYNKIPVPDVSAAAVLIKDLPSGAIIYAKNEKTRFPPASTTKIITALVALDNYSLEKVLTVKTIIDDGRKMGLVSGEKITAEALLYGALVHSANDAAFALAENYRDGVAKFVEKMNEKTRELNLSDTHFTNPIGFDDANQYTTADDLTQQSQAALSNKTFAKIVSTRSITVSDVNFSYFHELRNVNELLGKVAGVAGVKTGFTENAGEILVSEVKKQGRSVLFVVLKSADRFGETAKLIDWVFNSFTWEPIEKIIPTSPSQ